MTPNEYQNQIAEISQEHPIYDTPNGLHTYCYGLLEECGEVAGLFKRLYRGDNDSGLRKKLKDELGDVLGYLVLVAHVFDLSLEDIMQHNLEKVERRYKK